MNQPALKSFYFEKVVPALKEKRGYKNPHQVPAIEKIVLNSGVSASLDKNAVTDTAKDIGLIVGQKPVITKARVSIANFKLREGMPVGVKVTLRGDRMYEFLHRLLAVALPSIRDFRGVPTKLDGRGNYNLGITDHTIFPEISIENVKRTVGMDITIVTTADTDEEGRELLSLFGMPFRRQEAATTAVAS